VFGSVHEITGTQALSVQLAHSTQEAQKKSIETTDLSFNYTEKIIKLKYYSSPSKLLIKNNKLLLLGQTAAHTQ